MADNLKYNEPGSGPTIKTDQVENDHYQVIKFDLGPDGQAIPLNGSVPVTIVSGTGVSATVTVSVALPAGTNNIGDVDVLSLPSIPAGTNNIGDVDVLTLPSLPAGTNNIGDVDVLTLPNPVVVSGVVFSDGVASVVKYVSVNATADGDNTIIAGVGGKKIRVLAYVLAGTLAGTYVLQDTAGSPNIFGRIRVGADGGGASFAGSVFGPAFETIAGNGVEINCPAGGDMLGHMTYMET